MRLHGLVFCQLLTALLVNDHISFLTEMYDGMKLISVKLKFCVVSKTKIKKTRPRLDVWRPRPQGLRPRPMP